VDLFPGIFVGQDRLLRYKGHHEHVVRGWLFSLRKIYLTVNITNNSSPACKPACVWRDSCLPVCMLACLCQAWFSWPVCMSACLPVRPNLCLPVCMPACLYVRTYSCLSVWMSACLPMSDLFPVACRDVCHPACLCQALFLFACLHTCLALSLTLSKQNWE